MSLWLIVIFVGLFGICLAAIALGVKFTEDVRRREVKRTIQTVSGEAAPVEQLTSILKPVQAESAMDLMASLPAAGRLERMIKQAGMTWSVPQLLLMMLGGAILGALAGMRFRVLLDPIPSMIALALVVGAAPLMLVARNRTKRMHEFEAQFPDALDFLARSMRAGHAFSVSLEMLAEEMAEPLAYEFRQVFNEQNLGMTIDGALKNLHARLPTVDVGFFVSAVLLQKETGGNLAEILTKLSYIIRERFRLKLKVRTASAHGRLTGTILTLMPFVLMMLLTIVVPDYLPTMINDSIGRYLVIAAVISQFIGFFFIRKIINIKV